MNQQYAYSPDTGELIQTQTPDDWMGVTDVQPPQFDSATSGCFWRNGAWQLVPSTPAPAKIAPISPRQIRQALTRTGLRQQVETAVAAGDQDLKDWWEFATVFEREHPMVVAMGDVLGQTPAKLDALWSLAASL